ncbi:MAG: S8 family serine peptidase [Bdellovibrionales bacterium]
MASENRRDSPLINPILSFLKEAVPESVPGGGKNAKSIVSHRLDSQRKKLSSDCLKIFDKINHGYSTQAGLLLVVVEMFEDSTAQSWSPRGLLNEPRYGCRLVAPAKDGYLVEVVANKLSDLANYIRTADSIEPRVDISRIKAIKLFDQQALFSKKDSDTVWQTAEKFEGGRGFIFWLAPFHDGAARRAVMDSLKKLEGNKHLLPTYPHVVLPVPGAAESKIAEPVISPNQSALAHALRHYQNKGTTQAFAIIPTKAAWEKVVASGAFVRIDPVHRIEVTSPGEGAEPTPPMPIAGEQPIVAVVDGGLTAKSYLPLEAWRAPPLIRNAVADSVHGNCIVSLVVQAHAWNSNLHLPQVECRIGNIQAVPKSDHPIPTDPQKLVEYLRQIARDFPEGKIWNMSFNQVEASDDPSVVSYLGHKISELAREFGILPVISVGNRKQGGSKILCPPADCEAALTVSGRSYDASGDPAGVCPVSLKGPAPDGMLKPDLSWFSSLRMIGGAVQTGSSYAVPLVSSLAAHTYANLKNPSPDLVKALLINKAELDTHDTSLGWGTPWEGHLPWTCAPGTVTLVWRAKLEPGYGYYWNNIPIPAELIKGKKLVGRGSLTAIINPVVSEAGGPNYFATRLQVALQYQNSQNRFSNLLGSMKEDKEKETQARAELAKWHSVRKHARDFSARGVGFSGSHFRLFARVFTRDLFQFGLSNHHDLGEQEVAFALTFSDGSNSPAIFNSMAQQLGTSVESAVINQEIEVEHNQR